MNAIGRKDLCDFEIFNDPKKKLKKIDSMIEDWTAKNTKQEAMSVLGMQEFHSELF